MPDLTITLTNAQAQRVATALGVSSNVEAVAAIKAILKERVKALEALQSREAAIEAAKARVDVEFPGF